MDKWIISKGFFKKKNFKIRDKTDDPNYKYKEYDDEFYTSIMLSGLGRYKTTNGKLTSDEVEQNIDYYNQHLRTGNEFLSLKNLKLIKNFNTNN
jgi:hypothetical protein